MEVTAAVSRDPGTPFSVERIKLDAPRPDEILVRIVGVGLCHSDLLARDGIIPVALPAVFGHEGAGEVVAVGGDIHRIKVGHRVVLSFGYCGHCSSCRGGEPSYCDSSGALNYSGGRPDGSKALRSGNTAIGSHFFGQSSFASFAVTPERNAVIVDNDVPLDMMGPLGCGIQTGAGAILNTLSCGAGSSLLITGGGSLGLSAVLAAVYQQCSTIIVSEVHGSRRELALKLGATHVIDPTKEDLSASVRAITPHGVDYAFDTTGLPPVLGVAAGCLGKRGVLAIAGVPPKPDSLMSVAVLPMVGLGQTIKGTVEGDSNPADLIPKLISMYREGRFPFDRLIKKYPLSRINDAVADHHAARCVKAILVPDELGAHT